MVLLLYLPSKIHILSLALFCALHFHFLQANEVPIGPPGSWKWMDCVHGTFYNYTIPGDTAVYFGCMCEEGWTGIDCSLCTTDSVCDPGEQCRQGMQAGITNALSCIQVGTAPISGVESLTVQFLFPNGSNQPGTGSLSVFNHIGGAPFIFNCSFDPVTYTNTGPKSIYDVQIGSCYCSSWCITPPPMILHQVLQQISTASFTCDNTDNHCVFAPVSPLIVFEVQCNVSGCRGPPLPPQLPDYSKSELFIIYGGTLITFVIILIGLILLCVVSLKLNRIDYLQHQDHTFEATLSWNNLSCSLNKSRKHKRSILRDVSGHANPGQVTAILGPSGAGKTTFLDILAGRKTTGNISGHILINGKPRPKNFTQIAAYVMQEDKMLGTFTVKEHLNFIAALRLPTGMTWAAKETRIDHVLEELGISHIAKSYIGTELTRGISGGEKRRLSIASELVTDPSILFLDEPTSGLDSYNAHYLIQTLLALARKKNRTIITTIHQPRSDIYTMFDNVILLGGGELIYNGKGSEALDFFQSINYPCPPNYNPADHMIDVVTMNPGKVKDFSIAYRNYAGRVDGESINVNYDPTDYDDDGSDSRPGSANKGERVQLIPSGEFGQSKFGFCRGIVSSASSEVFNPRSERSQYAAVWFVQVWILCKRTLLHNIRNPYLLRAQYLLTISLAVMLGFIFWKLGLDLKGVMDRAGVFFFLLALFAFGAMSSIDVFFQERPIFVRERASGMYRTSTYFISKTVCDLIPMRVIPPLILGAIMYPMVGLRAGWLHFAIFEATLVLSSLVAASICLAIGSATPSLSLGNLLAILMMLFSMLFAGFLVNKSNMPGPIGWIRYTSFLGYSFEIAMVNELDSLVINFNPQAYNISTLVNGAAFLLQYDLSGSRIKTDFGILVGMAGFYLLVAYCMLRWVVKEHR